LGIILINKFHGDYETGIFTAAHQLIKYAPEISVALSMGTMPAFANIDIHNLDHFIKSFKRILYMSSSVYLAIALVFFLLGGLIIDLAFGIKYDASTAVLKLLLPFMIIVGINTLLTALLNYWGKIRQLLISFGISTIIGVTLMFILIPPMGAKGLAIALSAQMIPTLLINTYFIRLKIRAIVANE
jgi:O-antigen/teichoic acid export membrane protein